MSLKLVVLLAFIGSIALTMILLSCTLKFGELTPAPTPTADPDDPSPAPSVAEQSNCWTLFVLFFYLLAPLPILIARRVVDDLSSACFELASEFIKDAFIEFVKRMSTGKTSTGMGALGVFLESNRKEISPGCPCVLLDRLVIDYCILMHIRP